MLVSQVLTCRYKKAGELKTEIQNARDRIATINKNLENELENYSEKQSQSLRSIMSNKCYVEKLNGEKIEKLIGEISNELADIIIQPTTKEEFIDIVKPKVGKVTKYKAKRDRDTSDGELL